MIPDRLRSVLSEDVMTLSQLFHDRGHDLYLVGGSVRDALLARPIAESPDLDFTTSARPDEVLDITQPWAHSSYLAGKDFGTIGLVRDGCFVRVERIGFLHCHSSAFSLLSGCGAAAIEPAPSPTRRRPYLKDGIRTSTAAQNRRTGTA